MSLFRLSPVLLLSSDAALPCVSLHQQIVEGRARAGLGGTTRHGTGTSDQLFAPEGGVPSTLLLLSSDAALLCVSLHYTVCD